MFQQAPIPDHTYWNTAGIVPRSLSSSIAVGDLVALRRFLSDKLDEPTSRYGAPLHQAVYRGNEEAVKILLQAGTDPLKKPDTFDLEFPTTPFGSTTMLFLKRCGDTLILISTATVCRALIAAW